MKKRIQLLAGLLVVITGCLVWNACKLKSMKDQYVWGGTLSAPREYPIEILQGYLMSHRYTFIPAIPGKELDHEQKDLRVLRNKYLHWSSHYEGAFDVMAPTKDRERIIYE